MCLPFDFIVPVLILHSRTYVRVVCVCVCVCVCVRACVRAHMVVVNYHTQQELTVRVNSVFTDWTLFPRHVLVQPPSLDAPREEELSLYSTTTLPCMPAPWCGSQ